MRDPLSAFDSLTSRERKVLLGMGAACVVIVVVAAVAFLFATDTLRDTRVAQASVQRTRDAIEQVQQIFSLLQDAETGERGFVITGREGFLEPFNRARATLDRRLDDLRKSLVDEQAIAISDELAKRAREQMAFLESVVELRGRGEGEAAIARIAQESGKRQMDAIRVVVARLQNREQELLIQRRAVWDDTSLRSERIIQLSFFAAIIAMFIASVTLAIYVRRQLLSDRKTKRLADLLRSTVESITQGVVVFDKRSRLVAWNRQYLDLRGLNDSAMQVGGDITLIQKHATPMTLSVDGADHDSREASPGFGDLSRPFDGEGTYSNGRVLRISGRPAAFGHYVVTVTDISALKKSEAAHRDQATRLNTTLDNIDEAIITINEVGKIESWSQGAERLLGYSDYEVLNRNVGLLIPEPHATAHDGYLSAYLKTGERHVIGKNRDVEALHKDGRRIDVEIGISEMFIDSRRMFVAVVRDIAQRLEVERLKSGFVSTVSHELRTPLTSISASLGLVEGTMASQLSPQAARLVQIAKQNSDRLVRLINDILELEKSEAGKIDFQIEELSLMAVVQQAIEMNRGYAASYHAAIQLEASDDASVSVDRDRLIQVLTNLISNAAKFSPRDGVIHVEIKNENGKARVTVQDEGPGISAEFQKRIFQKFAQADATDSRSKSGTGLGLSIAKTIVERMGGSIGFNAQSTRGACFYITLPIRS